MAFRGIYPALDLVPLEFGLFSAALVTDNQTDEQWVRGFSFEFDSRPTVRLVDIAGAEAHEMFDGTGLSRFREVESFYIEVEDFRSTFNAAGEDRFARVLKQLEAATQKAVEREFWNGYVARSEPNSNEYLTKAGLASYASETPATAVSPARGIALLEWALSNSPVGEQGVLHITRDIAASLGSNWLLMRVEDDRGKFHVETVNGTTTVSGAGYTGDGPIVAVSNVTHAGGGTKATVTTSAAHNLVQGETVRMTGLTAPFSGEFEVSDVDSATQFKYLVTAAGAPADAAGFAQMVGTADVKWIYASGKVGVLLGDAEVVNESLAQGYDVSGNQNDLRIKAQRPAAVYFDPATTYAVKVDLT
jgi:hypothetical protein